MTAPQRILVRSAFVAALLAGLPASKAADFNWSPGSGIWSDPLNWDQNPLVPPSDPATNLFFGGTGSTPYTATNDILTVPLQLNSITLNSSATVENVIDGLALSFAGAIDRKITQSGSGAFTVQNDITITGGLTLTGTGTGLTTLGGAISGSDGIFATGGNWRLTNIGSTYTGGMTVGAGALVELDPTTTGVSIAPGASSVVGDTTGFNPITIDGGTLKFTTQSGGTITFGDNRQLTFGPNGGTLDLVNTAGGNIAGGNNDLSLVLNNGTNTAVVKFNGGQNALSAVNSTPNGDWSSGNNVLRLEAPSGGGNLRVEVTNGAAVQVRTATFGSPLTVRGVVGGDPTSSPDASVNANISLTTGRFFIAEAQGTVNYSQGLTLEGAVQVSIAGTARAANGNIVVAGTAGGAPGYVTFSGRGTGTALGSTIRPAGHGSTGDAGQYPIYIGVGGDDTLTIQDGGVAVFDSRIRHEQSNNNAVLLNATAVIEGGGELRIAQSLSNATAQAAVVAGVQLNSASNIKTTASAGHHIIDGNIRGEGTTTRDAVVNLLLPAASGADTNSDGVPDTFGDLGGVVFRNSNIVVNGSGFGGLRVNANPRPNNLFDSSGTVSDPVPNADKVNNLLTPARINALTGSGGYLTVAPTGETYTMPNAEWDAGVSVGLKVVNHNPGGVDVQFDPAKTSWGHNLVVDTGAELSTGTNAFTMSAGTLHGTGTVSGSGGITIDANAAISPGLGGIGTLTVGNITLGGSFLADFSNTGTSDLLAVNGNLNLGGVLIVDPASTFNNSAYTILTYSGALTGTFTSVVGLPLGYTVNYGAAGQVRLVYGTVANLVWAGTPGTVWSTSGSDANWQDGGSAAGFTNGDAVTFSDSGTGTIVAVTGLVEPGAMTFNNTSKIYTINGASGTIGGAAALVKNGPGTVILSGGSHVYGGGTQVNVGTLRLGSNDVLPDLGAISVAAGATFDVNGNSDTIGDLNVSGSVTTGTLTTGAVTLEDGASFQANLKLIGNVTKNGTAGMTLPGSIDLNGEARTFTVPAAASGPGLTLSGVISNGTLVKDGDGEMLLSVVNSYSGGTVVDEGILKAGVAGAIPNGALTVNTGGTADLNGHNFEATSLSGSGGTVMMNGAQLTLNVSGVSAFSGEIAGTGTKVIKTGSGAQTLSGASSFDGGLTINAGRVNLTNGSAAGFGDIEVNSGGSLQSGVTLFNNIKLNGGTLSSQTGNPIGAAELNVTADSTIATVNQASGARSEVVFTGILRGSGNLLVTPGDVTDQPNADQGAGFRLRGISPSDYTGTVTVAQKGKFEIQMGDNFSSNPLGDGKIVMTAGTSTGSLQGTYTQLQPRLNTAAQVYELGNDLEISGTGYVNANILGSDDVVAKFGNLKIGDGQILGANKNDSAIRSVEFPTVTLTGGTAEFRAFDPAFGNSGTATRGGSNIRLGDIGESEAGSGVIFQSSGNATTNWINEIFGTATYTGPTSVTTGTLRVSGSIASSSEVTVSAGAKLDVTSHGIAGYTIPAAQTLAGGGDWDGRIALRGTLSPGTDLTMETMTGDDFTLHGNAPLKLQLSLVDNFSDRISLTGAFDKGDAGAFVFDFDGTGAAGFTYSLVQFTSTTFTASDFSFTDLAPGLLGSFQMTATELQFVVVPEPSVAMSILGGVATLLGWRRRRRA